MPRLLNRNPAYRKHKATGQAVVTLNGRDYYLGQWQSAASKAEYERRIRQWQAAGGQSADRREELTFYELLAAFLGYAKTYHVDASGNPNSELVSFKILAKRLGKIYGGTRVSDFGPLAFKAFRKTLID